MIFIIAFISSLMAKTPAEILERALEKQTVENSIQTVEMTLFSKRNAKQKRIFELWVRRDDDALRSYSKFTHPVEIAGTQLVLIDRPSTEDALLLYLPALKRIQRIAGKSRRRQFMGSDFSYTDLELSLNGEEQHSIIEENAEKWIIETIPGSNSNYEKIISHVSKSLGLPLKIEYYNSRGHLKTLDVLETRSESNTIIPILSRMSNHQKGTKTELHIKSIRINVPKEEIPLEIFTAAHLKDDD